MILAGTACCYAEAADPPKLDPLEGAPIFGMEIVRAEVDTEGFVVESLGALYELRGNELRITRRIDPRSNTVNPRRIAAIQFDEPLAHFSLTSSDKRKVQIDGGGLEWTFRADGVLELTNGSGSAIQYELDSELAGAPWEKRAGTEIYQTDGYGYFIHAARPDLKKRARSQATDKLVIQVPAGAGTVIAVGPPKPFDFSKLYGKDARPFVMGLYSEPRVHDAWTMLAELSMDRIGLFLLFSDLYDTRGAKPSSAPVLWGSRHTYQFASPGMIDRFVADAHKTGFKLVAYAHGRRMSNVQSAAESLAALLLLVKQHNLDGVYLDNAGAGENWYETYAWVRALREQLGDDAILYHHDSVDVWGGWSGRVFVPIDAYFNYTLKGETGPLAALSNPYDDYVRYYTVGYGTSQALATQLRSKEATVTWEDLFPAFNAIHGVAPVSLGRLHQRVRATMLPLWREDQQKYLDGKLEPDIQWPRSR